MMSEDHTLMDGKVHVYKRDNSKYWQCSTYMNGRNHRKSTKHKTLAMAMEYAREWYMAVYVDSKRMQENGLTQFLLNRASPFQMMDAPAPSLHSPLTPRKKAVTGPTFAEAAEKFIAEYEAITQGERNEEWTRNHFMRLRVHLIPHFGDIPVKQINAGLVQEYRIARNTNGYCKSMAGAILPFQRMQKRHPEAKPTDKIFGKTRNDLINQVLNDCNLKYDRDGNVRTAYSLRHTYICLRLMEGADIYQIAKNCRTSVEMIEQFYASHIKNTLDASAINIRKPRKKPKKPKG